jgi:hypothetical protein
MPDDGFLDYLGINFVDFEHDTADTLAFHANDPEGYGIDDTEPAQPVDSAVERESFVEHIADAFRALIKTGHVEPDTTGIVIYQGDDSAGPDWCADITITRDGTGYHVTVTT